MSGDPICGPCGGHPSDRYLVRRAQDGDVDAFADLVRRHADRAYRVSLRLLNSREDAEDATQEALVAAWKGLGQFRADAAFSTWLYRIVTNTALNHAKRRQSAQVPLDAEREDTGQDGPALAAEAADRRMAMYRAIAALPQDQRAPLVLHQLEGMSYEEVARIMDITVSTARVRTFRARRALAELLQEWR